MQFVGIAEGNVTVFGSFCLIPVDFFLRDCPCITDISAGAHAGV